jgi:hypothetical protein
MEAEMEDCVHEEHSTLPAAAAAGTHQPTNPEPAEANLVVVFAPHSLINSFPHSILFFPLLLNSTISSNPKEWSRRRQKVKHKKGGGGQQQLRDLLLTVKLLNGRGQFQSHLEAIQPSHQPSQPAADSQPTATRRTIWWSTTIWPTTQRHTSGRRVGEENEGKKEKKAKNGGRPNGTREGRDT